MPVPAQPRVNRHQGNGVTDTYAYSFRILNKNDIGVEVAGVTLTVDVDYTVTGVGNANGGSIVYTTPPANLAPITHYSNAPYERMRFDYVRNGSFKEETVDGDFDQQTILIQQLDERFGRGLFIPITDAIGTNVELPAEGARAGKVLTFDSFGNVITLAPTDLNLSLVTPFIATLIDDEDAEEARATLGAGQGDMLISQQQAQTNIAFTTTGTAPTFILATTPAYGALSAGQRFRIKWHAPSAAPTLTRDGLAVKNVMQYNAAGAKVAATVVANMLSDVEYDGTDYVVLDPLPPSVAPTGKQIAQIQYTQTGTVATGTTPIPNDNTIPQNTEGDQYMSQAITPQSASSILEIEIVIFGTESTDTGGLWSAALFQDSTANALAAGSTTATGTQTGANCLSFRHRMIAGTTSSTTFKVRAGLENAGTFAFNGKPGGGQQFGGVLASSLKITEFLP